MIPIECELIICLCFGQGAGRIRFMDIFPSIVVVAAAPRSGYDVVIVISLVVILLVLDSSSIVFVILFGSLPANPPIFPHFLENFLCG